MKKYIIIIFIFLGFTFSQCDNLSQLPCNNNSNCEWIIDIQSGSCSNLGSSSCDANPNCWGAYTNPGWYYGWYCAGGNYQIDNSYCQEVEVLECSEYTETQCNNPSYSANCAWVDDVFTGACDDYIYSLDCNSNNQCSWTSYQQPCTGGAPSDCTQPGCSYSWLEYTCTGSYTVSYCSGGNYEINNGYCEDIELLECSQYDEFQCISDSNCNWINDYQWANCSDYNNSTSCYAANNNGGNCSWSWNSTLWQDTCGGGSFQLDISYCNEVEYSMGDVNQDYIINVMDIILVVNLILDNELELLADFNNDHLINVIDIIMIVDIILQG